MLGQPAAAPADTPAPSSTPPKAGELGIDLKAQLRAVVADATGYPEDVLSEEMSLEADLGIGLHQTGRDSIQVKKAVPQLPELDAAALGALETLGDVANHLAEAAGPVLGQPAAAPPIHPHPQALHQGR